MRALLWDDPRKLGPYELMGRLGSGGMGVVFLAGAPGGGLAAVKTINAEYSNRDTLMARFSREAALARRVQSPYVARFLDSDAEGPVPWLAMDYVEGQTLQDIVTDTGAVAGSHLPDLAAKLARALADLHDCGIVHRDIKPSNVILRAGDPIVIDLGIATDLGLPVLTRAQTPGTVGWLSPEQTLGWKVGPRTDVFSWGAVVLYAATGRRPFTGDNEHAVNYAVQHATADLTGLPVELQRLVEQALQKNPEHRPPAIELTASLSLAELLYDVGQPEDEGEPVTATTVDRSPRVEASRLPDADIGPRHGSADNPRVVQIEPAAVSLERRCFLFVIPTAGETTDQAMVGVARILEAVGATVVAKPSGAWTALVDDRIVQPLTWHDPPRAGESWTSQRVLHAFRETIAQSSDADRPAVLDRWLWLPSRGSGAGRLYSARWSLDGVGSNVEVIAVERDTRKVGSWRPEDLARQFPRHGKRWTRLDHELLEELFESGVPLGDIADRVGRTPSAVCDKLVELGHVQPLTMQGAADGVALDDG